MTIHTIGDSHSSNEVSGWRDCNNIISHHIGATLCYSFGKENINRCDISKFNIKDDDSVIFCFGEIGINGGCKLYEFFRAKKYSRSLESCNHLMCHFMF